MGHLSIGAGADLAVFELIAGDFGFVDSGRARMSGQQKLECQMTLRAGEIVWDNNGLSRPDYEGLGDYIKLDGKDWSQYEDWTGYDNS